MMNIRMTCRKCRSMRGVMKTGQKRGALHEWNRLVVFGLLFLMILFFSFSHAKENTPETPESMNSAETGKEPLEKDKKDRSFQQETTKTVYLIPVSGDVEPGLAAFLKRSLEKSAEDPGALVVLKLDTYGGRLDSAFQMVEDLINIPKGRTIAYVSKKAISAGALIALACNDLYMNKHTTIGDCAPIMYSEEGPKMLGEKIQSPLRARFRSLAKRNGYPAPLAEAMVTAEKEIFRVETDEEVLYLDAREYEELSEEEKEKVVSKKTVVEKGELLTMDDTEALYLGFSRKSVDDLDDVLDHLGIRSEKVVKIKETWSESLVRILTKIAPILMMIGLAALYTEIQSPGFGVPGIIGIVCLGLVFMGHYLVGLADYTELLIMAFGLILLGFELFVIPGFGIAGVTGIVVMAVGMILSLQDFVVPDPKLPWEAELLFRNILIVVGAFVGAFLASMIFMRYIVPRSTRVVSGPYLAETLKDSKADSSEVPRIHVGDVGVAHSFLRPSGKMRIETDFYDVICEGGYIPKDSRIQVMDIRGNRVIVREIPREDEEELS